MNFPYKIDSGGIHLTGSNDLDCTLKPKNPLWYNNLPVQCMNNTGNSRSRTCPYWVQSRWFSLPNLWTLDSSWLPGLDVHNDSQINIPSLQMVKLVEILSLAVNTNLGLFVWQRPETGHASSICHSLVNFQSNIRVNLPKIARVVMRGFLTFLCHLLQTYTQTTYT